MPVLQYYRWPALNEHAIERLVERARAAVPGLRAIDSEWCFNVESADGARRRRARVALLRDVRARAVRRARQSSRGARPRRTTSRAPRRSRARRGRAAHDVRVGVVDERRLDLRRRGRQGRRARLERSRRFLLRLDARARAGAAAAAFAPLVHDRMTECVYDAPVASFAPGGARRRGRAGAAGVRTVPLAARGAAALRDASAAGGLGFDEADVKYYAELFGPTRLNRDPTASSYTTSRSRTRSTRATGSSAACTTSTARASPSRSSSS